MFEVSSEISFSAAHHLKNYNGPCENVHGHNWLVRAHIRCEELDETGIGIDFKNLKALMKEIVLQLDHKDLNTIFDPDGLNPSSENIARYLFFELEKKLDEPRCTISRIDVCETPGNCASYFGNA